MLKAFRRGLARQLVNWQLRQVTDPKVPVHHQRAILDRSAFFTDLLAPPGSQFYSADLQAFDADWVTFNDSASDQLIIYLHGGGFIAGSSTSHRDLTRRIARTSRRKVLSVNYALAPEHTYPAGHQDCLAAYEWALANGYASEDIVIGGDSAGGFFTLQTLLGIKNKGWPQPAGAFFLSPLTDALYFDSDSYQTRQQKDPWLRPQHIPQLVQTYLGKAKAPATFALRNCDLSCLPPLFIQVGDEEILLGDSENLHQQAQAFGVDSTLEVWPQMWHVFQAFAPLLEESDLAIEQIGNFIHRVLSEPTVNLTATNATTQ